MSSSEPIERFVKFFKALGDANRIKIIGLLSHKPHSVEELAANLGVTSATVSHHLSKLQQADLVEARVLQYYNVYALRTDVLRAAAEQLATATWLDAVTPTLNLDAYSAKILSEYWVRGRLKELPGQLKKREVILRHVAQAFEPGKRYSEKRVNKILKSFATDVAMVRRELINFKLLVKDGNLFRLASH